MNIFETILAPFIQIIKHLFLFCFNITGNCGISIILLSFAISLLLLPVFILIEKAKKKDDSIKQKMQPLIDEIKRCFEEFGDQIAAVILEPVLISGGVEAVSKEFLQTVRSLTTKYGSVLIFDEVITGFRLSYSSAQGYFGVTPDLTCLGKIIGGGMPIGAYGGKKEIMAIANPDNGESVWVGGSILAMIPEFEQNWISRAKYFNEGIPEDIL